MRKTWPAIAGFEHGRRPWGKKCGQLLESGKGEKTNSPVDLLERKIALILA